MSLVIRAKNESKWLWRCLKAIQGQTLQPSEVILVDNESSDRTIPIARNYGVDRVVRIEEYSPGAALNRGIEVARGNIIAVISAHCIPASNQWLEFLISPLMNDASVAASYGRQLPLPFSSPEDKADLYAVYRPESRLQVSDGFLNNANSAFWKKVWEARPFDEKVTNIEDRVWGDWLIQNEWKIFYESNASVYHHNGMHRSSERRNQAPTVEVIESRLGDRHTALEGSYSELFSGSICPVIVSSTENEEESDFLSQALRVCEGLTGDYWLSPVAISELEVPGFTCLARKDLGLKMNSSVDMLIQAVGRYISEKTPASQYLAFFIPSMGILEASIISRLVDSVVEFGKDFAFVGKREYAHIWHKTESGEFFQLDPSMSNRAERRTTFVARYGQGSIFSIQNCVSGDLFAGKAAIVEGRG